MASVRYFQRKMEISHRKLLYRHISKRCLGGGGSQPRCMSRFASDDDHIRADLLSNRISKRDSRSKLYDLRLLVSRTHHNNLLVLWHVHQLEQRSDTQEPRKFLLVFDSLLQPVRLLNQNIAQKTLPLHRNRRHRCSFPQNSLKAGAQSWINLRIYIRGGGSAYTLW